MKPGYNLIHEPWVVVVDRRNARREVSLLDAFERADEWRGLGGEMPTQQVAILRLMLAICYRALRHDLDEDDAAAEWGQWWVDGLPVDRIRAYLSTYEDRFDLLDAKAPFMQVADLNTASGKTSGLSKLIAEVPDGHPYFTTRAGRGLESISLAEAARWIVHCQAYDPSGIKSGAIGDERVKGGKGYPIGPGWAGYLGLIVAQGESLAQTLLLNLIHDVPSPHDDAPFWERPPHTAAAEIDTRPRGPVSLLTWQTRRLRLLIDDGGRVVDALVANGDRPTQQNAHVHESMSGWRRSANQEKVGAHGSTVYMPATHQPERAVWRGLAPLLEDPSIVEGAAEAPSHLPPATWGWLARLKDQEHLAPGFPLRVSTVGIEYGSNSSVISGVIDDALVLPVAVLTDAELRRCAVKAVEATELGVRALRDLAANLARAAGGAPDGVRERIAEAAWHALDALYRRWVSALNLETDTNEALAQWHRTVLREIRRLGEEAITASGQKAFVGRVVVLKAGGSPIPLDAGLADAWFRAALHKALDRAYPADPDSDTKKEDS